MSPPLQQLTLEEMLALAKKVKLWQQKEGEWEWGDKFTIEGYHKGIKIEFCRGTYSLRDCNPLISVQAHYNDECVYYLSSQDHEKKKGLDKLLECYRKFRKFGRNEDKVWEDGYWEKREEIGKQYLQEAKQLAREAMGK